MSQTKAIKTGQFHALSRAIRYENEPLAGTIYKSSHNILTSEVWSPSSALTYVIDYNNFKLHPDVKFYERQPVKMVPGSNGEAYYITDNSGNFVKKWISPTDLPNSAGAPSNIIDIKVYDRFGTIVNPGNNYYSVDYFAGMLKFELGATPKDINSDTPPYTSKLMNAWQEGVGINSGDTLFIDVFVYTGPTLQDVLEKSLSGLTDVIITNPLDNQVLVYSGNSWINAYYDASGNTIDLSPYWTYTQTQGYLNSYYTSAKTDELLANYYTSAQTDELFSVSSHTHTLSGLSGIIITLPQDNQVLVYSAGTWMNANYDASGNTIDLSPYWTIVAGQQYLTDNYYTSAKTDELLTNYYTSSKTDSILQNYVTTGQQYALSGLSDVLINTNPVEGMSLIYSSGTWQPSYPVVSGGLTIQNNWNQVSTGVTTLNFIGTYSSDFVKALPNGDFLVDIWFPAPAFVSHFNTSDSTTNTIISNFPGTSRHIAKPTSEGNPYKIGSWSGLTMPSAAVLTSGPITYSSNRFSCTNLLTTITVNVYAESPTTLITTNTVVLDTNKSITVSGVTINISNLTNDTNKYKADFNTSIDIDYLFPNGGRISKIEMLHDDGTEGIFSFSQSNFFYEKLSMTTNPSIASVSISETSGQVITKKVSGIEYYTTGSKFTVVIPDIDNLNGWTYPVQQVTISALAYGLPSISLAGSQLTGWTEYYNNVNDSYIKTDWAINASICSQNPSAVIYASWYDWVTGSVSSTGSSILVNTVSVASSRLIESFDDESWRCALTANFDAANARGWTSSSHVGVNDVIFGPCLKCGRLVDNFTTYSPNSGSQPNYSSQASTVYLIREFKHNGLSSSQFTVSIGGTYTSLEYKLAKAWDGSNNGGTVWISGYIGGIFKSWDFGNWNNGNPLAGTGGYLSGTLGSATYSFGSNNISNTFDTVYVRIGFTGTQSITSLGVSFS